MAELGISELSRVYVKLPVRYAVGSGIGDPTSFTVEMAFAYIGDEPVSGDWKAASWETSGVAPLVVYYARCIVGPGGTVTLAQGEYVPWVRITAFSEVAVIPAQGTIVVF